MTPDEDKKRLSITAALLESQMPYFAPRGSKQEATSGPERESSWLPGLLYNKVVSPGFDEVYGDFVAELPASVGERPCLDVGCGPGDAVISLARRDPAMQVIGVDISPTMVGTAFERARKAGTWNAHFELGDACKLSFASDSAGLVWSVASIKHWSQPVRGLEELYRVAAPGASIVIAEVDRGASDEVIGQFLARWRLGNKLSLEWLPLVQRMGEHYFRRVVTGQSYGIDDLHGMLETSAIPAGAWDVEPVPEMPFWIASIRKPMPK